MKKAHIILLVGIIFLSCVAPPRFQRNDKTAETNATLSAARVDTIVAPALADTLPARTKANTVLSTEYIDLYKSNELELKRVQVYLGTPLVLVDKTNALQKNITESHGIEVQRTEQNDTLIFNADLPGVITRSFEDSFFLLNKMTKIEVSFDSTSKDVLLFHPDNEGIYRLESESGKLNYGGRTYNCLKGCAANYLLVNAATRKATKESRRYVPGRQIE